MTQEFQLQIEKIANPSSDKASTAVFSGRVSFEDGTVGTLVSCILVKGDKSEEVKNIFDLAIGKLKGAEKGSLELVKNATGVSGDFIKNNGIEAGFIHCLFYKNAGYVGRYGDGVKVWVYEGPRSLELTFLLGSGPLKSGQLYLIATEKFLTSFDLSDYLNQDEVNVEEIVDGLATEISAKRDKSEIAAALIHVKSQEIEETKDTLEREERGEQPLDTSHEIAAADSQNHSGDGDEGPDSTAVPVEALEPSFRVDDPTQSIIAGKEPRVKSSLLRIPGAIFSEISKLRRGDLKAIFRLKRNVIAVAVIILLILSLSAFFTLRGNENRNKFNEFNKFLESATSKYEEGLALLELNQERAKRVFIEADSEVKKALVLMPEEKKALELDSKISSYLQETSSRKSVSLQTVFTASESLVSLAFSDSDLVGVSDGKVYVINIGSGKASDTRGINGAKSGFVYDDKAFVFDGSDIHKVDLVTSESEKIIEGEKAGDISVFLGNIYLISGDQIYKYTPFEGGYAKTVDYLSERRQFSEKSRFSIDGSIWVTNGSEIIEYLRGEKQDFAISGLTNKGKFEEIYTDVEVDNIYVVDIEQKALLVFDKKGVFKESYQSPEFGNVSDLVVDEEGGKFYIIVGNKVLGGDL